MNKIELKDAITKDRLATYKSEQDKDIGQIVESMVQLSNVVSTLIDTVNSLNQQVEAIENEVTGVARSFDLLIGD